MTTHDVPGDRCPGVFRLFPAADGGIARLRFPGGRLTPADWTLLARLAREFGDGNVHLTSRGNLQIRGVTDAEGFAAAVREAGRAVDSDHDRVRNILASPLAGRLPGRADLGDLVERLDAELVGRSGSGALSGRFLVGLDDGSGDVLAHSPDLAARLSSDDAHAEIAVVGHDTGLVVDRDDLSAVLVDAALVFADAADGDWRIADAPEHRERVVAALVTDGRTRPGCVAASPPDGTPTVGWIDAVDGTVSLLAVSPFGVVPARLAEFLGAIDRPTTVSADKVVGIHELTESMAEQVVRVLAPMGLVFDAASPWTEVTACTGLPGCAKSLADVRADAASAVREGRLSVAGRQHWVGCERRCGAPGAGAVIRATGDGYTVEGESDDRIEP